jgi:hypothetical protein
MKESGKKKKGPKTSLASTIIYFASYLANGRKEYANIWIITMATSEEKRVVREAIWKLIYRKQECWQHLLGPVGVPWAVVEPYFRKTKPLINPATNRQFSKYEASPFIIAAIEELPDGQEVLRKLVKQIAEFNRFELSQDELQARAVVEKAKDLFPAMETRLAEEERVAEELAKRIEAQQLTRQAEQEKERKVRFSSLHSGHE